MIDAFLLIGFGCILFYYNVDELTYIRKSIYGAVTKPNVLFGFETMFTLTINCPRCSLSLKHATVSANAIML